MWLRRGRFVEPLVWLLLFSVVGILMLRPSLGNPWFWDDLHWFRYFSFHELASTWVGNTDPQGIMTPGFRPLQALTNFLLYELFPHSPDPIRWLAVAALAVSFTLFVAALRRLGVSVVLTIAAGLLALTSKNMTYTYAWASDGYQAFQMAAFAGCLYGLARGLQKPDGGRRWLRLSVVLWVVTLFLKDQGLLLFPSLLILAFLAGVGGFQGFAARLKHPSAGQLATAARSVITDGWRRPPVRGYVMLVSALTIADGLARVVLVPQASPGSLLPRQYALALVEAVSLAGHEDARLSEAMYVCAAAGMFTFLLLAARFGRLRDGRLLVPWLVAIFAALSVPICSLYGLDFARQDIADFPILFYGLFVASGVLLAVRLLGRHRRLRVLLIGATAALTLVSVSASIRASIGVQQAMSSTSILAPAYNYVFVYGTPASRARIAPATRTFEVDALRKLGITGPLSIPQTASAIGFGFSDNRAFGYLYCRALADPRFPARIPKLFPWGREAFPPVTCNGSRVVLIG